MEYRNYFTLRLRVGLDWNAKLLIFRPEASKIQPNQTNSTQRFSHRNVEISKHPRRQRIKRALTLIEIRTNSIKQVCLSRNPSQL
jgi:hypothetical protein